MKNDMSTIGVTEWLSFIYERATPFLMIIKLEELFIFVEGNEEFELEKILDDIKLS